MLIEFSVGNYKSFKEKMTFSLVAAKISAQNKQLDENNTFPIDTDLTLLRSAAIYGANASGKSNLVGALGFMRDFVLNSSKATQFGEAIGVETFRLHDDMLEQPAFFEVVFIADDQQFRYGFEATPERVVVEWLYHVPTIREAKLFRREADEFEVAPGFREGRTIHARTRANALFLSVVAQFNGAVATKVVQWFSRLTILAELSEAGLKAHMLRSFERPEYKDDVIKLIKQLDTGIDDIQIQRTTLPLYSIGGQKPVEKKVEYVNSRVLRETNVIEQTDILTGHRRYDQAGNVTAIIYFDIHRHESDGTRKIVALAGPIVEALKTGAVLFVDELDARLHPLITRSVLALFNSQETNPKNAQLIFATHDTNLLDKSIFRRDQIWFAEKDRWGATHLYSLVEYKVRNDASFEKDYIHGRYGAIPFIGDLTQLPEAQHG
jgi:uncharacterized protein